MVLSGYLAASQQEVPTKKYVVAFADIVGSTRLYESAGDDVAKALVTEIQSEIAEVVSRTGGVVHEIVGDEVMFLFDDVNPGVACACQLQQAVESFSVARGLRISVRIGLHFGPAIMDQGRLFGDTVNTAARMAGIARGGQIVVTQAVVEDLTGIRRTLVRRFDQVRVKGKAEELVVFDLLWRLTNVTEIRPASVPVSERALTLTHRQGSCCLQSGQTPFSIGRGTDNDLVVAWGTVSRKHASVDFARGRFVLSDVSTNGTYVRMQGGESVFLRRESLPLWGRGQLGLGAPLASGAHHVIDFDCG